MMKYTYRNECMISGRDDMVAAVLLAVLFRKVPDYWIDVEYREPQSGKLERTRAAYMVRSMEHLIGCDVGVYIWLEWSDYAQMNFTESYVDTYDL